MRTLLLAVLLALLGCGFSCAAMAEDSKPASLDDQLLEDLGERSTTPARPKTSAGKPSATDDRELIQDLTDGEDLGAEKPNPLVELAEKMKLSKQRIGEGDTSPETQQLQRDISDRIAKLLEQVEKQSKSSGGGGGNQGKRGGSQGGSDEGGSPNPGQASDSTQRVERPETVERGSADVRDVIRRVWGHLPDKMREQMQSSVDERFLPKYEKLIEQYYQRLAEERGVGP
jgi:hypothetical protein